MGEQEEKKKMPPVSTTVIEHCRMDQNFYRL
jgi:hypothetical protein